MDFRLNLPYYYLFYVCLIIRYSNFAELYCFPLVLEYLIRGDFVPEGTYGNVERLDFFCCLTLWGMLLLLICWVEARDGVKHLL